MLSHGFFQRSYLKAKPGVGGYDIVETLHLLLADPRTPARCSHGPSESHVKERKPPDPHASKAKGRRQLATPPPRRALRRHVQLSEPNPLQGSLSASGGRRGNVTWAAAVAATTIITATGFAREEVTSSFTLNGGLRATVEKYLHTRARARPTFGSSCFSNFLDLIITGVLVCIF